MAKAQCPVDFISNVSEQCAGQPVTFSIVNPQPSETYVWSFGDGINRSTALDTIVHIYQGEGPRSVSVYSVTCGAGSVTTKSITIKRQVAFSAPSITYTSTPATTPSSGTIVCVPAEQDTIEVTATLTNTQTTTTGITSYTVDWGNGESRTYTLAEFSGATTISNPTAYTEEGEYPIKVTANSADAATCSTTQTINFTVGKEPKAIFTAEKKNIIQPSIACGLPVRVELTNESTGGNLTYLWEVESNGQPTTDFEFIDGTTDTDKEPVLKFNKEGRYTIRLRVNNPCVDPDDPDGPKIPYDPNNPDNEFDEDGKYVQEEQIIIVYPQANIQSQSICEEVPGQPVVLTGTDLGVQFDANTELTVQPGTIVWTVTGGATIVGGDTENPTITFPRPGNYNVSASFRNECFSSEDLQPANPPATITIQALPPKARDNTATICADEPYEIRPGTASQTFIFYDSQTGGSALNATPSATLPVTGLTATTTYYVAAVNQNCENPDRSTFILNVIPSIEENTIELTPEQTQACQGTTLTAPINGSLPTGGNGSPLYIWQQSLTGNTNEFSTAAGTNNSRTYLPPALSQTTYFRRLVTSGDCAADTSNIVMITVSPPITNNTINNVGGPAQSICAGAEGPELTGSQPDAGAIISWESSTTSATATDFAPASGINNEANYTPGALTQTTWFRRRITNGGCTNVTAAVEINVTPALDPATNTIAITGPDTFCSTNGAQPQLTGPAMSNGSNIQPAYLWESSLTGVETDFVPARGSNNINQNYTAPASINQTTYYRRRVTIGNCAPIYSNIVTINFVPPVTDNTITATQSTICRGTTATLTGSTPAGGNGTLIYLWESSTTSATAGFNPATGTNNEKDYTPETIVQTIWFRRTVTSSGIDCPPVVSNALSISIEELPASPDVEATAVRACAGTSATLRVTSTGATYEWYTTETGGTPVSYDRVFITPPLTTNTIYYVQAVSANSCVSVSRTPVRVTVSGITADAGRDTTIIQGQTLGLQAKGGTQYVWTPAEGLNNTAIPNPVARPMQTTTYTVTITTEDGCTDSDDITITVIPRVNVFNTFSPNRDGINETWEIQNIENYPEATVEIFNRWGNQVFKSEGTYQPWDGTYKGAVLPLATYYYIIRLNKDEKPLTGSVTLIR